MPRKEILLQILNLEKTLILLGLGDSRSDRMSQAVRPAVQARSDLCHFLPSTPFLRGVKARIGVWVETIKFNINAHDMLFRFQPQQYGPGIVEQSYLLTKWQRKRQARKAREHVLPVKEVTIYQDELWKEKWGTPIIQCSILNLPIKEALCDLGASVNVMPLTIYKKLEWFLHLSATPVQVHLADSTLRPTSTRLLSRALLGFVYSHGSTYSSLPAKKNIIRHIWKVATKI